MKNLEKLDVYIDGEPVGTLAIMNDGMAAFQYSRHWLNNGFAISPLEFQKKKRVASWKK